MKIIQITLVLASVFAFVWYLKNDTDRYEIIRVENALVRLDKKTGETLMFVSGVTVPIDFSDARDNLIPDPLLSQVKSFEKIQLPESKKKIDVIFKYRWINGVMDYRFSLSPYDDSLNNSIISKETVFTIILYDEDQFEVSRFDIPFSELVVNMIEERKSGYTMLFKNWEKNGSFAISKSKFKRIVDISYSWVYSDQLRKALNE